MSPVLLTFLNSLSDLSIEMNIKNVLPNLTPIDSVKKPETPNRVITQESTERDADGRKDREQEEQKQKLTDEEWQEALEKLKQAPGMKTNHLSVQVELSNDKRIAKIVSPTGDVVRRLTEGELWSATRHLDIERPTGQLFDKAM